jgi:hypothetical protein
MLKRILILFSILFLFHTNIFSLSDSVVLEKIQSHIQKKEFLEASKIAEKYLKNLPVLDQSDKIIRYYFLLESNLDKLDQALESIYKSTDKLNFRFHSLVFILIEKSLLVGDYQIGVKWGEIYKKEARSKKKKYFRGLYFYACHLYKLNDKVAALTVVEQVLREKTKKNLKDKLTLLKILHYKNEYQFMMESKNFIRKNPDSNYVDIVFVNMIQNIKLIKQKEKLNELKLDFSLEHKDSILYDTVTKM